MKKSTVRTAAIIAMVVIVLGAVLPAILG